MRILLIEDDPAVAELVRRTLTNEGYETVVAPDAGTGRQHAFGTELDAILLDLNLPDGSGLDLMREIRERGQQVPVLILTGRVAKEDVVQGLDIGADDYITKPFDLRELVARIRAVTRRVTGSRTDTLLFQDIELDRLRRDAHAAGEKLKLTPKEFGVLEALLLNPGRVVSRQTLLEHVWGMSYDPGTNVVDVQITHLRAKVKATGSAVRILNVRGSGFRLTPTDDDS